MKYLKKFSLFEASKNIYKPLETIGFKFIGTETPEKNILIDIFENKDKEKLYIVTKDISIINAIVELYKLGFKIVKSNDEDYYKRIIFKYKDEFKVFGFNDHEEELTILLFFTDYHDKYRSSINNLNIYEYSYIKEIVSNKDNLRTYNDYLSELKKTYNCYIKDNKVFIREGDFVVEFNFLKKNSTNIYLSFLIKSVLENELMSSLTRETGYFDSFIGFKKDVFLTKVEGLLENYIKSTNQLIDKMIEDDKYFHEIKGLLPNDIMNKYLERINNDDSLI